MMSDVLSEGSEPESQFDWHDFNEEKKNDGKSVIAEIRKRAAAKKPASILKTSIKMSADPTKPPLIQKAITISEGLDPA